MDVSFATVPTPGRTNEDHIIATGRFVAVLDGATVLPGVATGCVHGPAWFARSLGAFLALHLPGAPSLQDCVATAIDDVRMVHVDSCDLTNPDSPSATVAVVRERDEALEYLVLCDSSIAFEGPTGCWAVTDDRTAGLPRGTTRHEVARYRNTDAGFWIASTDPHAARHAVTGAIPLSQVYRCAVLTDGAARLVTRFDHTWPEVFARTPREVVDAVRSLEHKADAPPRGKPFDDATIALCDLRSTRA